MANLLATITDAYIDPKTNKQRERGTFRFKLSQI